MASVFDNWALTLDLANQSVPEDEKGIFMGNGKIGLVSSFKSFDVEQCMITTQLKYYNGSYKSNMVEGFYVTNLKFFDNAEQSVQMLEQKLDMASAIFKAKGVVTKSSESVNVVCDTFTPYQLPFCIVQSYTITPVSNMASFDLFHELYGKETIVDVEFNNNVIFNELFNNSQGLYVLSGKGRARTTSETIASASCYLFDSNVTAQNLGFNAYRRDPNRCYNRFRLTNLVAGTEYKFHIVSAMLTNADFENPIEEVKRIVLNVANKGLGADAARQVRGDHCLAWSDLWKTDLVVNPKAGISAQEANKLVLLKRSLRYSLYNIFSSIRENINLEVNPMNLSVIDYDGSVLYDGDIWLIPVLIILKPDMARALLEYRYHMMTVAKQLAAGYGYKGAKFPYTNDTVGYKNSLYYDLSGPLSLFNTALISINVWNYFRITRDRDWLSSKGFPMLKENADFFASRVEQDPDGTFHLRNVVGLNSGESKDLNAFTVNLVKLALRFAMEATYELSYHTKEAWVESYYNIDVPYYLNQYNQKLGKIKFDADDVESTQYDVAEPLFNLIPYYSFLYWLPEAGHYATDIKANIDLYSSKLNSSQANHPFNRALFAINYGLYAQYDPAYVQQFETALYDLLGSCTKGVWHHLGFKEKRNDLIINSMLLFVLMQAMGKVEIQGGVAETRYYYDEMRIAVMTSANMPNTWKQMRINGTGDRLITFNTTNSLYYIPV